MHTLIITREFGRLRFTCECGFEHVKGNCAPDGMIEEHRKHLQQANLGGAWLKEGGLFGEVRALVPDALA